MSNQSYFFPTDGIEKLAIPGVEWIQTLSWAGDEPSIGLHWFSTKFSYQNGVNSWQWSDFLSSCEGDVDPAGYAELCPEYDVFSFGIVLLQLLTGRSEFSLVMEMQAKGGIGNMSFVNVVVGSFGCRIAWNNDSIESVGVKVLRGGSREKARELGKKVQYFLNLTAG